MYVRVRVSVKYFKFTHTYVPVRQAATSLIKGIEKLERAAHRRTTLSPTYSDRYICVACVLYCSAACCSVSQRVAACCSVLQRVAACCVITHVLRQVHMCRSVVHCIAACCSVLQRVAACYTVLQCVARRYFSLVPTGTPVLQCVILCCSVLQRVATCCSVLRYLPHAPTGTHVSQCLTLYCSVLQRVAACCSVAYCIAVRCSACVETTFEKGVIECILLYAPLSPA